MATWPVPENAARTGCKLKYTSHHAPMSERNPYNAPIARKTADKLTGDGVGVTGIGGGEARSRIITPHIKKQKQNSRPPIARIE